MPRRKKEILKRFMRKLCIRGDSAEAPVQTEDDQGEPQDSRERPDAEAVATQSTAPTSLVDIEAFSLVHKKGEGRYGEVWKAFSTRLQGNVAIKRIKDSGASPISAIRLARETKILRHLRGQEDIVHFHAILTPPETKGLCDMLMVFECMPKSLREILEENGPLKNETVCALMFQLVRGVRFMHKSNVLHRDLKPENILIDPRTAQLKICDFGLARVAFTPNLTLSSADELLWTRRVVSSMYKAPEILNLEGGRTRYNSAIDVWSLGCIFGEMILGRPMFSGSTERVQLAQILTFTGVPSEQTIQQLRSRDAQDIVRNSRHKRYKVERVRFDRSTDPAAINLIRRMLQFNPNDRPSAEELLKDPYFASWLAKVGCGKDPVEIDAKEFAFDRTFGNYLRVGFQGLYQEVMKEVSHSLSAAERDASEEIRRARSRAVVDAMKTGAWNPGIHPESERYHRSGNDEEPQNVHSPSLGY